MSLQDLQNGTNNYDPTSTREDFLEQMLCGLQSGVSWPDISAGTGSGDGSGQNKPWDVDHFDDDQSSFLVSKLRQHQITAGNGGVGHPLLLSRGLAGGGNSGLFENDMVDASSFKSPDFHYPPLMQGQSFGSPALMNNTPGGATPAGSGGGGPPAQPRQRVRARRGQATDPHSIAERLRRERIAERMKSLQELVPNANKTDKASMLDEIIDYVKFLQLQVKVLSMSRLGGAGPGASAGVVAPLVADITERGGHDGLEGGSGGPTGRSNNGTSSSNNDHPITAAENQVVKLMEEDMGAAMQYLQGKGLCLMPISLATAISTSTTCHPSSSRNNHPLLGGGPSSPNLSVLTVQSANGVLPSDGVSVKDSTSVSKP